MTARCHSEAMRIDRANISRTTIATTINPVLMLISTNRSASI
jgi:hypothetical protein